jgi:hypothetical protein
LVDIKKNLWIIALVAGILGLVSILIPAFGDVYGGETLNVWFWNMYTVNGDVDFIDTEEALYDIGIATTIILIVGTVITLLSGILAKLKESKTLNLILYMVGGILLLIGPIVFFGATAAEYEGFWDFYNINAGIVFPFIAGGLAVLVGVYGIINQRS